MVMGSEAKKVCEKVFPQHRPNASTDTLKEFIVVSMPYAPSNKTIGEDDDWWIDQTVVFEIFVADKKSAAFPNEYDVKKMKKLRADLRALFPIIDATLGFKITRPRTVITASTDGNGFHYSRVQARMSTMI